MDQKSCPFCENLKRTKEDWAYFQNTSPRHSVQTAGKSIRLLLQKSYIAKLQTGARALLRISIWILISVRCAELKFNRIYHKSCLSAALFSSFFHLKKIFFFYFFSLSFSEEKREKKIFSRKKRRKSGKCFSLLFLLFFHNRREKKKRRRKKEIS